MTKHNDYSLDMDLIDLPSVVLEAAKVVEEREQIQRALEQLKEAMKNLPQFSGASGSVTGPLDPNPGHTGEVE
tara:strand:- start:38313 stop:38531 length:219 start_codon:yes stop_codon:yes gene_type:complete